MNHRDQVLDLLKQQIGNPEEVDDIKKTAEEVVSKWVNPLSGGKEQTNGLIYGLVQSGKTGVLTATGAIGADEGYRTLIILTSDNDPLYDQTLSRAREAFPGIDILGKRELRDQESFIRRVKGGTCAIVVTKNAKILETLIENFQSRKLKGLTCLIIDDEADQASLNTRASRNDGTLSPINQLIADLRAFFDKNTYLQVTATPQALFLQTPGHSFRPKFTVLSHPGQDYVGGEEFFGDGSVLVREFPIAHVTALSPGSQPRPSLDIPTSLMEALDVFMIGATFKRMNNPQDNCAFLCHVSTRKRDHDHIVDLLFKYKDDLADGIRSKRAATYKRLNEAYAHLCTTHAGLRKTKVDALIETIGFFSPGITVKLVNGETDEDVALKSPYNLFVGGNKLGRGVTIRNLLVSYYGRNPVRPQADTVLQHARMYGYRRKDLGLLRLFLPPNLHGVFRAINRMEIGLRDLIARKPDEEFRGIYVEGGVRATRRNVLAPGAVGIYTGGGSYNPAQVIRTVDNKASTAAIDKALASIADKTYRAVPLTLIHSILGHAMPDESAAEHVWNDHALLGSITQYGKLTNQDDGYVYVDRERGIRENRRETQGILDGGEAGRVPGDKLTLFLLRTRPEKGESPAWWPQIRFPGGQYGFAFAI